jgi:hypothetical protein
MISQARRIYFIQAPAMYPTAFSTYAARVGYKEAIKIDI